MDVGQSSPMRRRADNRTLIAALTTAVGAVVVVLSITVLTWTRHRVITGREHLDFKQVASLVRTVDFGELPPPAAMRFYYGAGVYLLLVAAVSIALLAHFRIQPHRLLRWLSLGVGLAVAVATVDVLIRTGHLTEVFGSDLWTEFGVGAWLNVAGFILIGVGGFLALPGSSEQRVSEQVGESELGRAEQ